MIIRRSKAMILTMLKSKLHRATVTQADLNYEGSITIDRDLMDTAGLLLNEQVDVLDITNGNRLTTYVIEGERGSGVIGINGAAAHLVKEGDLVIICSYAQMDEQEAKTHVPKSFLVDEKNRIKSTAR
ncbi:MAG: aspartate 1-decarboxylase [Alphaproteobacteria bacterium]